MKRKILITSVLVIALISLVLYYTLATDITMRETTGTADLTYNIDINDTDGRTITVEAGKTKVFDIFITNKNGGSIKYGLAYKPNTTTDIKVKKLNTSINDVTGIIANNTTLQVTLVIENKSTNNLTYNIVPITGYEKGGDLIVSSGYTMISEVYEFPEYISIGNVKYMVNSRTPDFSKIATTDEGIYSAEDDYGKSYYFRGAVTNNYVKFANKFWRIIRINGDGSIRMIYDGTTAHNNGESSTDREITTSAFNSSYNSNAYVGYMYGKADSSTYELEHANTNNTTIKGVVDSWYKTNIVDKGFNEKVADVIYCNDRSIKSGIGTGTNKTYYKAYERLYDNKSPILTCSQKNDAFTVEDTTKGNGALTYPVGLITADEVSMAGGVYVTTNKDYYLYTGDYYWNMSPFIFNSGNACEFYVYSDGRLNFSYVSYSFGVRPVLSLKSKVQLFGSGTKNDPFVVQ